MFSNYGSYYSNWTKQLVFVLESANIAGIYWVRP